jgi:ribonuclease HI
MNKIIAYTDGSAVVKGRAKGNGGFGTYFPNLYGSRTAFSLGFEDTKTGRMELSALYYAITAIELDQAVTLVVYSDSEYVVKSFTLGRLDKWIKAGWRNTSGEVKNQDMWKAIKQELNARPKMELEMIHIRSHQVEKEKDPIKKKLLMNDPNIIGNMMADRLADYKRHKQLLKNDKLK